MFLRLGPVLDGEFEDQLGAGVAGLGGGEVFAELVDGLGGPLRCQRVQADGQVAGFGGVDVARLVEGLAHERVGFVGGTFVGGVCAQVVASNRSSAAGRFVPGHVATGVAVRLYRKR